MRQLTGLDATFLYLERPHAPENVLSIQMYDQSSAPGGRVTFKGILAHIEARLHLARAFREKVVRVPGDLDHPWWVDDPAFDLEYHVRHLALPKPGDWRQFCIQAARLHARPLDLSRPLWEMYVIEGLDAVEGLPSGSFATVLKMHHSAIDGKSGAEILSAIHTQTPTAADPPPPETPWRPQGAPPAWELAGRACLTTMTTPARGAELASRLLPGIGRGLLNQQRQGWKALAPAPNTRFNGPISAHRVLDACFFDLDDVRKIRSAAPGATVNDVALTVLGGALHRYLADAGEPPSASLRAMVPISVRTESQKADLGNQVSAMTVTLASDVPDPLHRLAAVTAATVSSKELATAVGARNLVDISQFAPGALVGVAARLGGQFARLNRFGAVINTVISNVPGPREPLYFAGAELLRAFGGGPIVDGTGLIHAVNSVGHTFSLSFVADRDMMPDPARYADCIRASFVALRDAV